MSGARLLAGLAGLLPLPGLLAGLHVLLGTPQSPHHRVVVDRPLVAIVGGRAEHCLPETWRGQRSPRVVNLARRATDWRAVLRQIDFVRQTAPPGVLVVAMDPEQLLYDRATTAGHRRDPDRTRRVGFAAGGASARLYGAIDRWLSLPRLLDEYVWTGAPRLDPEAWGRAQGQHWADPDGLIGLKRAVASARYAGIQVVPLLLPLPDSAVTAWRSTERGAQLDRIRAVFTELEAVDHLEDADALGAYFPDGIGCARQTGRPILDALP